MNTVFESNPTNAKQVLLKPEQKLLLSMNEAAAMLGMCRSRLEDLVLGIDPMTKKPYISSIKNGRKRLVPRKALEQFVERIITGEIVR